MRKKILIFVLAILISGCAQQREEPPQLTVPEEGATSVAEEVTPAEETMVPEEIEEPEEPREEPKITLWVKGSFAIEGSYADAEVVDLGNGKYRMYYSPEPEVAGFKGQVYSALSSDGIIWNKENGGRMEWAIFPSVIKLSDGRYRMYFQNQGVIKSAISSDGLSWGEEPGIRIDTTNNAGLKLDNVAAPTLAKIGMEYIMVYRGTINEKYPAKVPNDNTQLFFLATSKDGLNFDKKGIALDSRNEVFQGLLDGPEFVRWDDGSVRLYFWSYRGIYHTIFKDNGFPEEAEFDFTTASDVKSMFPENPPGDPTLIKINGKWFMYYGQHGKGIFYATLEK